MLKSFRRLSCVKTEETQNNEDEESPTSKSSALDKLAELVIVMNSKLESLESKLESLELKIDQKLEHNLQNTLTALEKVPPSTEKLLNDKLNLLQKVDSNIQRSVTVLDSIPHSIEQNNNLLHKLDNNLKDTLNVLQAIPNATEQLNNKLDLLQKKFEDKLDNTLESVDKTAAMKKKEDKDVLESSVDNCNLDPVEQAIVGRDWKEYPFFTKTVQPLYPIEHKSFRHIEVKRDGDKLTSLAMNIAIKAALKKEALIMLSPVSNPGPKDLVYIIGLKQRLDFRMSAMTVRLYLEANLKLSMDRSGEVVDSYNICREAENYTDSTFTQLYDAINTFSLYIGNGKLTLSKTNPPYGGTCLISYEDDRLSTVKYFGFNWHADSEERFIFDCPWDFKGVF